MKEIWHSSDSDELEGGVEYLNVCAPAVISYVVSDEAEILKETAWFTMREINKRGS